MFQVINLWIVSDNMFNMLLARSIAARKEWEKRRLQDEQKRNQDSAVGLQGFPVPIQPNLRATSIAGTGGLHYLLIPGQPTMNAIQARSITGTGGIHYLHARSITGAGGLQSVQIQGQSTITAHQAISIAGAGELRYLPVTGQPNYAAGSIDVAGGLQVVPVPGQQALSAKYLEHDELIRGILIEICLVREGTMRLSLLFRQQTISI